MEYYDRWSILLLLYITFYFLFLWSNTKSYNYKILNRYFNHSDNTLLYSVHFVIGNFTLRLLKSHKQRFYVNLFECNNFARGSERENKIYCAQNILDPSMSTADTIWTAEDVRNNLNISNIQLLNTNVKYIGTRYTQNKLYMKSIFLKTAPSDQLWSSYPLLRYLYIQHK